MAHVEIVQPADANEELAVIYADIIDRRGALSNVVMCTSLNPASITKHMDIYLQIMFGNSPLKRWLREMMAVVVSVANDCHYCQLHHSVALNHFWKDEDRLERLRVDYRGADLDSQAEQWCRYAVQLTREPGQDTGGLIAELKAGGASDREIVDATLVISYFNFVNRLVLGLGVAVEPDGGEGYHYD